MLTLCNDPLVNELSGTIDLESTLIRAEALFRKFRRLIEAIDKKPNFPPPRLHFSAVAPSLFPPRPSSASGGSRPTTPTGGGGGGQQGGDGRGGSPGSRKVITPELRRLLSREVEVLPRKEVANNGDGFLAKPADAHVK